MSMDLDMEDPRRAEDPADGTAATAGARDLEAVSGAADSTAGIAGIGEAADPAGHRLRQALEPPSAAVERVVQKALAGGAGPGQAVPGSPRPSGWPAPGSPQPAGRLLPASPLLDRRRPLLTALAPALVAALLLGAGLWFGSGRLGSGSRDLRHDGAAVSITNVGDIVVARSGGRTRIVRSATPGAPPPAGELFIRYGGGE